MYAYLSTDINLQWCISFRNLKYALLYSIINCIIVYISFCSLSHLERIRVYLRVIHEKIKDLPFIYMDRYVFMVVFTPTVCAMEEKKRAAVNIIYLLCFLILYTFIYMYYAFSSPIAIF